jgi:hypothetical protein
MEIESKPMHMVWIGNKLGLLEQLTIKLYQKQGLVPHLWSYNKDELEGVPEGTLLRDAEEILPKSSLFTFRFPNDPNNRGHGSFSHWSDRFQLTLLQKFGGWYSQLDVACLKMPVESEYFFVHHNSAIVDVCVMKTPKNAPFIQPCLNELYDKVNETTTNGGIHWELSMTIIGQHITKNDLSKFKSNNVAEHGCAKYMTHAAAPPENIEFIHWWNVMCKDHKNNPKPGSFYHKLLQEVDLI